MKLIFFFNFILFYFSIYKIWSLFFYCYFLFEVIYEIRFFFQFHPPLIFLSIKIFLIILLINLKTTINKLFFMTVKY